MFGSYLTPIDGAPDVACDIKWNTGNNLLKKWPSFCRHYINRNFGEVKKESRVQNEPIKRRWWKNSRLNQSIKNQLQYKRRLAAQQTAQK